MPVAGSLAGAHALPSSSTATAGRFPDRPAVTFQLRSGPRDKAVTPDLGGVPRRGDAGRQPLPPARDRPDATPSPTSCRTGIEAAVVLLAGATAGIVSPVNPLLAPEHMAGILREHRRQGRGDAGAVPEDRPGRRRSPRRWRWRRASRRCSRSTSTRYLAPPLAWIVPLIRPKLAPAHRARVLDLAAAMAAENGAALDFAETRRRPGLRLLPHRRHHRPAEGGAAPGERHPLQRLVRPVLHLHRGGRADVPAAALPRLRRLSDPDVLPDDRGADGDADAAGLSRRRGDGQLLEADRAAPGHAS